MAEKEHNRVEIAPYLLPPNEAFRKTLEFAKQRKLSMPYTEIIPGRRGNRVVHFRNGL